MADRILIIDDEMHPSGNTEYQKEYGKLSPADLAIRIKSSIEAYGFDVEFYQRGEEAIDAIKNDKNKEIKLVLLDIYFTEVETSMQGASIFRKIKELRSDIPIVIITVKPARYIPREEDVFKTFIDLGAMLYIEKKYFAKCGEEQLNYINAILRRKHVKYKLKYRLGTDYKGLEYVDVDIVREGNGEQLSILKRPYRIRTPMDAYIYECIEKFPQPVHWSDVPTTRQAFEGQSVEFFKQVFKINDTIMRLSGGRIPRLLGCLGRVGCKLTIDEVEEW